MVVGTWKGGEGKREREKKMAEKKVIELTCVIQLVACQSQY